MNTLNPSRPILIAEDDLNDVDLLKIALKRAEITHPIQVVENGMEAVKYLRGQHQYADRQAFPFPEMLILDLHMPQMNGLEVIQWLKHHPECAVIPTVIFTSSQLDQDIHRAYLCGANAYLVKPSSLDELVRRIKLLFEFWSVCAKPAPPQKCS